MLRLPTCIRYLIFSMALLPIFSGPVWSQTITPATAQFIEGTAQTAQGHPAAGMKFYLLDSPGSEIMGHPEGRTDVITDSEGRFRWPVPEALAASVSFMYRAQQPFKCYALPSSQEWRIVPKIREGAVRPDWILRDIFKEGVPECATQVGISKAGFNLKVTVPPLGFADVQIIDSEGLAVAQKPVQLVESTERSNRDGAVVFEGLSDAHGRVRLPTFQRRLRIEVLAPGVGFGSTGYFYPPAGETVTPHLPRLASFSTVRGTVAPELIKAGTTVRGQLFDRSTFFWFCASAPVDSQGNFELNDLIPGPQTLALRTGAETPIMLGCSLLPGQVLEGVRFKPKPPPAPYAPAHPSVLDPASRSVSGYITDPGWKPVPGATVFCVHDYSYRNGQEILSTTSDDDGKYCFQNLRPGFGSHKVQIIAALPGHPLAQKYADFPAPSTESKVDLVIPNTHTSLTVHVLHEGQPAEGVLVRLAPSGGIYVDVNFFSASPDPRSAKELPNLLEPRGLTDIAGNITFRDLTPGTWNVGAVQSAGQEDLEFYEDRMRISGQDGDHNSIQNVVVRNNENAHVSLSIFPTETEARVRLQSPSGKSLKAGYVRLQYGLAGHLRSARLRESRLGLGRAGEASWSGSYSGLWKLVFQVADNLSATYAAEGDPMYEASTLVAISPAYPHSDFWPMKTARPPGTKVRVRIVDLQGKPVSGTVMAGPALGDIDFATDVPAGTTGVFEGLPDDRSLTFTACRRGMPPPPDLGSSSADFPSDEALSHVQLYPSRSENWDRYEVNELTFQPIAGAYVRGHVKAEGDLSHFYVIASPEPRVTPRAVYDPATGEYIAGPFPHDIVKITLGKAGSPGNPGWQRDFCLESGAGGVTHHDLEGVFDPAAAPSPGNQPQTKRNDLLVGAGIPISDVKVMLADGTTPAWGAVAAVVYPFSKYPAPSYRTDFQGRLSAVDSVPSWDPGAFPYSKNPDEPVLVAWLPGTAGATTIPLQKIDSTPLVLPEQMTVRGHITVNHESIAGLLGNFRVCAAYEGENGVYSHLSVNAPVDPNGDFELSGLSPGNYVIQATRDDIWLSQSQNLTVLPGLTFPDLQFEIARPGVPLTLALRTAEGRPAAFRYVDLARPAGPLADSLWPLSLRTDAHGELHLEGFEAGENFVIVEGTRKVAVQVPALGKNSRPVTRIITVQ